MPNQNVGHEVWTPDEDFRSGTANTQSIVVLLLFSSRFGGTADTFDLNNATLAILIERMELFQNSGLGTLSGHYCDWCQIVLLCNI